MTSYLEPTQESGRAFMLRGLSGSVVMLNLLWLRPIADYAGAPELAPPAPISGRQAYQKYIDHTLPYLKQSGGELLFLGDGGNFLIGPPDERWDLVLLARQSSVDAFAAFNSNAAYRAGLGHRLAALEDLRLLPLTEQMAMRA